MRKIIVATTAALLPLASGVVGNANSKNDHAANPDGCATQAVGLHQERAEDTESTTDANVQQGTQEGPNDEQTGEHQSGAVELGNAENDNIEAQDEVDTTDEMEQQDSQETDSDRTDGTKHKGGAGCSTNSEHASSGSATHDKSHDRGHERDKD